MNISTTPKRKDDISHTPEPQAEEEHDTEITLIVTPPTTSLKSILKHNNQTPPVDFRSPKKLPATSNEIRAAMTSSPSSPQSPEHQYSTHESSANNKEAGDLTEATTSTAKPRTRCVKRTLTREFNQKAKTNSATNRSPHRHSKPNQRTTHPRTRRRLDLHQQTTERNRYHRSRLKREMRTNFFSHQPKKKAEDAFRPNGF